MVASGICTGVTSNRGRLFPDGSHSWKKRVDAKVTDSPPSEFLICLLSSSPRKVGDDLNDSVLDWTTFAFGDNWTRRKEKMKDDLDDIPLSYVLYSSWTFGNGGWNRLYDLRDV
jgi:hypothetical protein